MCFVRRILVFTVYLVIIVSTMQLVWAGNSEYGYVLEDMGIDGPYVGYDVSWARVSYDLRLDDLGVVEDSSWIRLYSNVADKHIAESGYPMLPIKTFRIVVDGYVDPGSVRVWVRVLDYHEEVIDKPVIPAPNPLPYMASTRSRIEYTPSGEVYGEDKYFPGRILDYEVLHGLNGKTVIVLTYYPVQYNPLKNKLVVIDHSRIFLDYNTVFTERSRRQGLLIITLPGLIDVLEPLKEFYESKGYSVDIVDIDYIYENYLSAENITEYPGFYTASPVLSSIYDELRERYNWTLALKIISYIRGVKNNYSHILLVGNARDLPPSFYYFSGFIGDYDEWIPTDIFYASPDYDILPDLYVGRIPFSDRESVEHVVEKILQWYNTSIPYSRKLYMSGGYPFLQVFMFGETALSTFTRHGSTSMFNTTLLTRTSGNYNIQVIKRIFRGGEGVLWYFAIAHGDGESLKDYLVEPTETIQTLISKHELLYTDPNPAVPVVSSVACTNAAWDTELVEPWSFDPPSFGEAVLLSPAGGIAYIGSSRIAYEYGITFRIDNGSLTVDYYGASLLHEEILKAYNSMRGRTRVSLGEIVAEGISQYYSDAYGYREGAVEEIMKLALLGDPMLILPVYSGYFSNKIVYSIGSSKPYKYIDSSIINHLAEGDLPLYKMKMKPTLTIHGNPGNYSLYVFHLYNVHGYIDGYSRVIGSVIDLSMNPNLTLSFNRSLSGLILVKITGEGWGEYRFVLGAIGLYVAPNKTIPGGEIRIRGYGLDLLGIDYMSIYVAGRPIVSSIPVINGCIEWNLALPYLAPGNHTIVIMPLIIYGYMDSQLIEEFMIEENITVYTTGELSILVDSPVIDESRNSIVVGLLTLYKGSRIDANVSVRVLFDNREVNASLIKTGIGEYIVEIPVNGSGNYRIYVDAVYINETLKAYGSTVKSLTVIGGIYSIGKSIDYLVHVLNNYIDESRELLNEISRETSGIHKDTGQILIEATNISRTLAEIRKTSIEENLKNRESLENISKYTLLSNILIVAALIISLVNFTTSRR